MRSIIAAVGGGEFARIRVGVDRPYDDGRPVRDPDRVADWVLSRPSEAERRTLEAAVQTVADAVELAVLEGVELAMNRYNV
jgi:PTH1 family peptidyl-tRNA hydrolase